MKHRQKTKSQRKTQEGYLEKEKTAKPTNDTEGSKLSKMAERS
jgi:hypothetical protein